MHIMRIAPDVKQPCGKSNISLVFIRNEINEMTTRVRSFYMQPSPFQKKTRGQTLIECKQNARNRCAGKICDYDSQLIWIRKTVLHGLKLMSAKDY